MTEMHLRQPGLKFSTCGPFTKKGERMQKNEKTEDSVYIYQTNSIKFVFNMLKLMEVLKICLEKQQLIKY